jgi:uncharacterized membrane protein YqjE
MNEPIRDTAHSLLTVARSALDLAKAELQLAALEAKGAAGKFATALALACVAVVFGQIALLMLALTPVLLASHPWPLVLASLAIPTLGALGTGLAARQAFRRHRSTSNTLAEHALVDVHSPQ